MTHDDAKRLLAPLAAEAAPVPRDVSAWVMGDVRRLARDRGDDDRTIWRIAALLGSTAALAVIVAAIAVPGENPLVDLAAHAAAIAPLDDAAGPPGAFPAANWEAR